MCYNRFYSERFLNEAWFCGRRRRHCGCGCNDCGRCNNGCGCNNDCCCNNCCNDCCNGGGNGGGGNGGGGRTATLTVNYTDDTATPIGGAVLLLRHNGNIIRRRVIGDSGTVYFDLRYNQSYTLSLINVPTGYDNAEQHFNIFVDFNGNIYVNGTMTDELNITSNTITPLY